MSQSPETELETLLLTIAKGLVDQPDKVKLTKKVGENTTVFELEVDASDRGKVIGKHGRTADAIRTILKGASVKLDMRTHFEISE